MTHEQAHQILNRLKDGFIYPSRIIDKALWLTGDLDAHEAMRGSGMDQEIPSESIDRWSAIGKSMVATNHLGHRAHKGLGGGNRAKAPDEP